MNVARTATISINVLVLAGCSVAASKFPDTPPRQDLVALDSTRIVVKEEFKYLPTLTAVILPAGEYVPVKRDAEGTYYESRRGVLIQPVAGSGSVVPGGIYRRQNASGDYQFDVYGGVIRESLHNMWGLNLNEKVECTPACKF